MNKYQWYFIEKIKGNLQDWFDENALILEKDVHCFLHSVIGTAPTLGLNEYAEYAEKAIQHFDELSSKQVDLKTIQTNLYELIVNLYKEHKGIEEISEFKEELKEKQGTILLVDDDPIFVQSLRNKLENEGWMVFATLYADQAIDLFYRLKPDIVLLDIYMKEKNGVEVLKTIQKQAEFHFISIMMMSLHNDRETRIQCFQEGADDFIKKPVEMNEFLVRIKRHLQRRQSIRNAILMDELTHVYNRKFLMMEFDRQLAEYTRTGEIFTIAMIEIDDFKNINDSYGHLTGDEILRSFANLILENKRNPDYLIRYGGTEFVLLLPHTSAAEANQLLEHMLDKFRNIDFSYNQLFFHLSFSAGVVEVNKTNIKEVKWLEQAEIALDKAKKMGKNCVFTPSNIFEETESSKTIRIGIIDDEPIIRQMVQDYFENAAKENYHIEVKSFREGEEFFNDNWHRGSGPYVLILDGIMPRMDGLEVLKKLRNEYDQSRYIVVMLTGRKAEKDIIRALELGADDYITKPFNIKELEARIKRLINKKI
ncbi:GGDEF domain-containing response regulator [Bacillus taeanensis]|uniref:Diguanylate cyclase n=1 Tax=Bacillus taeanensis TaxID=273032 RepID=A0A366XTJ1_9BACI|nr:response regulator [Bacillus taeanensis]RBW69217.1 diguanylate cyclase [Bacillus taeanensis]